jgi:hypothetical protein
MSMNRFNCTSLLLTMIMLSNYATAQSKPSEYACTEANPAQLCNADNTCGSASTPCSVDVNRTGNAASSTASISKPKSDALFCVKVGTTIQFKSTGKDIGFVVDLGPASPFVPPGAIIGGSDRSVSVVAKTPGCYKYSAGACRSGAIYGMCGQTNAKLIVTP